MSQGRYLQHIQLAHERQLQSLVENRRIYNLRSCEMNVFETYQQSYRVPLNFNDFVITSMVRGRKVMHLHQQPSFDYLPGQTVILPACETMVIDFPDAQMGNPTQCIALAVDGQYMHDTLNYLNEFYNNSQDESRDWKLEFNQYHFDNDSEITDLINKLIRICTSEEPTKNIYADLNLKELIIRLVQSQYLIRMASEAEDHTNQSRLHFIIHYIHQHISDPIRIEQLCRKAYLSRNAFYRWFKEQCGLTPVDYINKERIKLAKQLLASSDRTITDVSMECGFSDVNYFVRLFKKTEGITPGSYRQLTMK